MRIIKGKRLLLPTAVGNCLLVLSPVRTIKGRHLALTFASLLLFASCDLKKIDDVVGPSSICDAPSKFKFEYSFGGGELDSATAIFQTKVGEYFITGSSKGSNEKILLYKTNICRDTLLYLSSGNNSDRQVGNSICPAWGGGMIVAGTHYKSPINYGYVLKVDTNGVIADFWNQGLDKGIRIHDIVKSAGSGYALGGDIIADDGNEYPLILLMDEALNAQKEVTFPATYGADINEVIEMPDGTIVGIGNLWFLAGGRVLMVETNLSGQNLLYKTLTFGTLGGNDAVYGDAATSTTDGNVLIAGHYRYFTGGFHVAFLKKVDLEGNKIWESDYPQATSIEGNRIPTAVIQTSDGGYLMVGTHKLSTANPDIFLLKVNANGQYEWDRSYGGAAPDYANGVVQETDGGFVIAGFTKSFNLAGEGGRVYLLKTDSDGNIN